MNKASVLIGCIVGAGSCWHPWMCGVDYAIYVYAAWQDPSIFHARDFLVYRFADTHPQARYRVQKLRVFESFRIPRLFGLTLSPPLDPNGKPVEENAMYKSVLFRPLHASENPDNSPVEDYMALVDHKGSFVQPWRVWFHQQLQLARNYTTLQDKAKKLLTIADVDMTLPYLVGESLTTRSRRRSGVYGTHYGRSDN